MGYRRGERGAEITDGGLSWPGVLHSAVGPRDRKGLSQVIWEAGRKGTKRPHPVDEAEMPALLGALWGDVPRGTLCCRGHLSHKPCFPAPALWSRPWRADLTARPGAERRGCDWMLVTTMGSRVRSSNRTAGSAQTCGTGWASWCPRRSRRPTQLSRDLNLYRRAPGLVKRSLARLTDSHGRQRTPRLGVGEPGPSARKQLRLRKSRPHCQPVIPQGPAALHQDSRALQRARPRPFGALGTGSTLAPGGPPPRRRRAYGCG